MGSLSRRRASQSLDIWPGFVDVLATLLIIVIFVLMVFVLAQFFLGQALSGRDAALARLNDTVGELEDLLAIERQANAGLRADVAQLSQDLQAANARWESLIGTAREGEAAQQELAEMLGLVERQRQEIASLETDRRSLNERLEAALGQVSEQEAALTRRADRVAALEADLAARESTIEDLEARREALREDIARLEALNESLSADLEGAYATIAADKETIETRLADLARLEAQVAELRKTRDALQAELEAANQTIRADKETIEVKLAQLARLRQDLEALSALRDELEDRIRTLDSRLAETEGDLAETEGALEEEKAISEQARAQAAMLNAQLKRVRAELARLGDLLDAQEAENEAQRVQIANLGDRLNAALATKVQELQRYRSEFFGRLREVLGNREGIRVEGDRFVFQSEVLFDVGEATLGPAGRDDLADLADTLMSVAQEFPSDIDWILRVDGHTDKRPINTFRFANNWELSAARAISVVRFLIDQGVPPQRLAAAGFGPHRPVAEGDTEQAYARNRRIELKLDQR
ncbi:peptidoglycan -binding protein [uncultured Rhodospira sp.]|uniref:peptidoglycan -binding protein n=1 Tax=uncultured Rhodospira sp. TaxID=1936189 RepID=UPI0026373751|nr:peptidoglycan -binding protein [uncultured Rhodospira sp.]